MLCSDIECHYFKLQMIRKIFCTSPLMAIIPVVKAATPLKDEPQKPAPMRPSELPIYETPHADYSE